MTKTSIWMALGVGLVTLGAGVVGWSVTHQPPQAEQIVHGVTLPAPSYDQPTQTPSSQTPVTKTPVTKTPVTKTPVTKTPVTKTPVTKTSGTKTSGTQTPTQAPAQKYPSLAAQTAQEPIASLSAIQAALQAGNAQRLGELRWNSTDAQTVIQTWGRKNASAATTVLYAQTFVYALLSDNASVINNAVADPNSQGPGFVSPLQFQGSPTNVSQIDTLQMGSVTQQVPWAREVPYTVTYTTTGGQLAAGHGYVDITLNPHNTSQWVLGTTGMLPGQ